MGNDSIWMLRRPRRWFNALLFYTGWLGLLVHLLLMSYCVIKGLPYEMSWWFMTLAPILSILWGGVSALQLQDECRPGRIKAQARFYC